ncbi:MAG: c-type cytochrome [Sphingobacteriales bacterium]|nr:c-type cytochrome [Sphingobacteriales bacterium]
MIPCKPNGRRLLQLLFFFLVFSVLNNVSAQDGKTLFMSKCAACHQVMKDGTGPALMNLEERGKWSDHNEILKWTQNPSAYMANDPYTQGLKTKFGSLMQSFPDITIKEIDAIVSYVNQAVADSKKAPPPGETTGAKTSNNALIFGVISLILAIIALILMQVNSNLKKMSDDAEGIVRPDPVPFYKNKVYIAMLSVLLFVVGGYYVTKGAIGLGRQKDYQPVQPIYYSHKVHAGINQINCLFCHGSAWESKTAGIPSVNVCMNCHKAITTYEKGPKLYTENGDEINANNEIAKLFKAAGFDPKNPTKWDPAQAKPVEWVKIHNLPDHVYFNHSQHVKTGKVQCQSCHGEITAMDEVKQFAELSMGWCINCHRNTKVDFNYSNNTGNKFYSIYEKFHNDIKAGKMDSVTVKDIGGLECQKCHY